MALDDLELLILEKYTQKRKVPDDEYMVWLSVGVQSFCVTGLPCESFDHAEWMREMLAKALASIVRNESNALAGQAHVLCNHLGIPDGHIEDRMFAAIGKVQK